MAEIEIADGKAPASATAKPKKIWWRVLLSFFGGFLAFPLLLAGAAAIIGMALSTKQVISMFGGDPNQVLTVEYQDKTILDTVTSLIGSKFDNLQDISNVTPMVEDLLGQVNKALADNGIPITISWEDIKNQSFQGEGQGTIAYYFSNDFLDTIKLVDFIKDAESSKGVFQYFFYDIVRDEQGNPIYDENGNVQLNQDDPFTIKDFMAGSDLFNNIVDYIKISDVVDVNDPADPDHYDSSKPASPAILIAIKNWKISDFNTKVDTLTIASVLGDTSNASPIINAIKDFTINDLTTKDLTKTLHIYDIFANEGFIGTVAPLEGMQADLTDASHIHLYSFLDTVDYDYTFDRDPDTSGDSYVGTWRHGSDVLVINADGTGTLNGEALKINLKPSNNSPLIKVMMGYTIADLSSEEKIMSLKVGDILSGSTGLISAFADKTLSELKNLKVDDLLVTDIFDNSFIQSNDLLKAIVDHFKDPVTGECSLTIGNLLKYDTIKVIKVKDIFTNIDEDSLFKTFEEKTLEELTQLDLNDLYVVDVFSASYISGNELLNSLTTNPIFIDPVSGKCTLTIGQLLEYDTLKTLQLKDVITNIGEGSILDKFQDKTIEEISTLSLSTIKAVDVFSTDDINNTPILKALIETNPDIYVTDLMKYENIKNISLSSVLGDVSDNRILSAIIDKGTTIDGLGDAVNNLTLDEVIGIYKRDEQGNIIEPKEYKEGISVALKSLADTKVTEINSAFEDLTLDEVIGIYKRDEQGNIIEPIEYVDGTPHVLKSMANTKVSQIGTAFEDLQFGQIVDVTGTIFDKPEIEEASLKDLDYFVDVLKNTLTLEDVVDIDDATSPKILTLLKSTKLCDIEEKVKNFKLKDIININDPNSATYDPSKPASSQIMISLQDVSLFGDGIDNLEYTLNNLMFKDVFTESQVQSNNILKIIWEQNDNGNFSVDEIPAKISNLTLVQILGDDIFDDTAPTKTVGGIEYKRIKSTWWYLLTSKEEYNVGAFTDETMYYVLGEGKTYKLTELDKLVTNMQYHLTEESLFNLMDAGFVTATGDTSKLERVCPKYDYNHNNVYEPENGDKRYGDLTVSEFLDMALALIP